MISKKKFLANERKKEMKKTGRDLKMPISEDETQKRI